MCSRRKLDWKANSRSWPVKLDDANRAQRCALPIKKANSSLIIQSIMSGTFFFYLSLWIDVDLKRCTEMDTSWIQSQPLV